MFIGLCKGYDSVPAAALMAILELYGVRGKTIRFINKALDLNTKNSHQE